MSSSKISKKILITAGETSGDMNAATLIDVLLEKGPFEIFAVGGPETSRRPVKMLYDSRDWAAIGYIEAIKKVPRLLVVLKKLTDFMAENKPDLLLLIDYPGFNMRLARRAKKLGIPTLFYFPPSRFAVNPEDVRDAAENLSCVAANFTFTYKVYKEAGANVSFVGHPLLDLARPGMPIEDIYKTLQLDPNRPIVGLCPGSRKSELDFLLPIMLKAAEMLLKKFPDLQFLVPVVKTETPDVYGIPKSDLVKQLNESKLPVKLIEGRIYDVMAISKLLLISSGTATLEASRVGTPMIIVYKVSLYTEVLAKIFNKLPTFIGLPNIILGRQAVPELIQHDFTPEKLFAQASELLSSPEKLQKQKSDLLEVISHLGSPGAHNRVAELAMSLMKCDDASRI
ncbi:MAG: lipid-A-disaccharide synthase [Candidatus Riflebacteria bacterium]|nr:lipid-A-disaccharide synthase [Candidatus Riflebacteria bacterium]